MKDSTIPAQERLYWTCVGMVVLAILLSLLVRPSWVTLIGSHDVQVALFVTGLLLTTLTVVIHGLKSSANKREWALLLGISAVYVMLLFRLGAPERTHLIEYSVLAIFLRMAFIEYKKRRTLKYPNLSAWASGVAVGIIDEGLQLIVPHRTFDIEDIFFNVMAVTLAIVAALCINWFRLKMNRK